MWRFIRALVFEILLPVLFFGGTILFGGPLWGLAVAIAIPLGVEFAIKRRKKQDA